MIKKVSNTKKYLSKNKKEHCYNNEYVNDDDLFQKKSRRGRPRKNKDLDLDLEIEEIPYKTKKNIDKKYKSDKVKNKSDKENYYFDPKRLQILIKQYNKDNIIVDELAVAFSKMVHKIAYMPNFMNYSWKEEMIGDGLEKLFRALKNKKFNPKRGNAFSYFSVIVYNAFKQRIKKEHKTHEVIKQYQNDQYGTLILDQNATNTTEEDEYD